MTDFYRQPDAAAAPLIVTALLDDAAATRLDAMRRAYFPEARNKVPAHLTLFHALPGSAREMIEDELAERCWQVDPMLARAADVRFTGHGVSLVIDCPPLESLRIACAQSWIAMLTPQDRQRFRPHVTVQNKVTAAHAQQTYDALVSVFTPWELIVEGLDIWHYRGGPWEHAARFPFGGAPS